MIYSDINSKDSFRRPTVEDLNSVTQSVRNIITCRRGEMLFLPEFGYAGEDYLFEDINSTSAVRLFQEIVNSINLWDDRVILDLSKSKVSLDIDNNAYKAYITFKIRGFNESYTVSETIGG